MIGECMHPVTVYAPFGEGSMKPRACMYTYMNCTYCVCVWCTFVFSFFFLDPFTIPNPRTEILVLKVKLNLKWVWLKGIHTSV